MLFRSVCKKEVWEDYPEFSPLEFLSEDDVLNYVRGDELLYTEPWWKMNSVSLYVLHGYGFARFGFGLLCLFICLTVLLLYMAIVEMERKCPSTRA